MDQVGVKWVRSGKFLEIYFYRDLEWINRPKSNRKYIKSVDRPVIDISDDERDRILEISVKHTRKQLRRRVHSNIGIWPEPSGKVTPPTFITLTIHENISDLRVANNLFTLFIKKLNYHIVGEAGAFIKYIAVPEFQKRGAVHYHVIFFNLPYIKKIDLERIWGHGFIKIEQIKELGRSVEYVLKYIKKDLATQIPKGMKRYLSSRGLRTHVVAAGGDEFGVELNIHKIWLDEAQIDSDSYVMEWQGKVDFFLYDLSDFERCQPFILAMEERYRLESNVIKEKDVVCDIVSTLESHQKTKKDRSSQLTLKLKK